jgi:hypothetical protein
LCETGIDCGGVCRPCDSCFNGVKDWTENGIDCGGLYCPVCSYTPILEFPRFLCEKSFNPLTNAGIWFLILLLLLITTRVYFYIKTLDTIHKNKELDEYKRAREYFAERRKLVLFVLIAVAIAFLAYLYYYEFLLCSLEFGYLWWFALLLILVPIIIYELIHFIEFKDKEKLIALGMLSREHSDAMLRMLDVENQQLIEIEAEVKELIEKIARDETLRAELALLPELRVIYKDIVRLFYEYRTNKSPYGIEKDLCQQVYAVETNEHFKELAERFPIFYKLYERLKHLFPHYESKQEVYDQIEQERARIQQHVQDTTMAAPPGADASEKFEGGSEAGSDEKDGENADEEKKE